MIRLLTALAAGAATMFLFDPAAGRRRRALLRDQLVRAAHAARRRSAGKGALLVDRSRGLVAEVRAVVRRDVLDDEQLDARVRARLGHVATHPHAVATQTRSGVVTLEGVAPEGEIDAIVEATKRVHGVVRVDSRLVAGDPAAPQRRRRAAARARRPGSDAG